MPRGFFGKTKSFFKKTATKAVELIEANGQQMFANLASRHGGKRYYDEVMDLHKGWVYSGVDIISKAIAKNELQLHQGEDLEKVNQHELLNLLADPNTKMTGMDLIYLTGAHLELSGNAYWIMPEVNNETDTPEKIFIANPTKVKIETTKDVLSELKYYEVKGARGNKQRFKPHQVMHLKYPDPQNQFKGLGTVQAIMDWILEEYNASKYNLAFFENGAKMSGILKTDDQRSPKKLESLRQSFMEAYAGSDNAYSIGAVPHDVDYEEMGQNRKELDFVKSQQLLRDKILAGLQVPKTLLGTAESDTNRATAETAEYVFAKYNIKPKLKMITTALNKNFVKRFGDNLVMGFEDPVPENHEQKMREIEAVSGGQPVASPNEVRKEYLDLPSVEGGDQVFHKMGMRPIGEVEDTENNSKNDFLVRNKRSKDRVETITDAVEKISEQLSEEIKKKNIPVKKKAKITDKTKNIAEMNDDEFEEVWKQFNDRLLPYEDRFFDLLKDFNEKQKARVKGNLREAFEISKSKKEIREIDEEDLFDIDEQISILLDPVNSLALDLGNEELEAIEEMMATELNKTSEAFTDAMREVSELLSQSYNKTTADKIVNEINRVIAEEGGDFDDVIEAVDRVYTERNNNGAIMVARTESVRIANLAAKKGYQQMDIVETLKWYTSLDSRVCPFCRPMHGETVGVEENFFDRGEIIEGELTEQEREQGKEPPKLELNYSDIKAPPLHVKCRCYIRPDELNI